MNYRTILKTVAAMLILSLYACESPKILFTTGMKTRLLDSQERLENVQFYNSEKITLKRELESNDAIVENGIIKFEDGKEIEYIIINKNTPGICESHDDKTLKIAFENEAGSFIVFGPDQKGKIDHYSVYVNEWDTYNVGRIKYGDQIYQVQLDSGNCKLMVEKKQFSNAKQNSRTAKGIRLD